MRPQPLIAVLADGVHALANEPVDSPCPRAERLRAALAAVVEARADPEGLLDTLTAESDPALFLLGEVYGTRASTLVAISADGGLEPTPPRIISLANIKPGVANPGPFNSPSNRKGCHFRHDSFPTNGPPHSYCAQIRLPSEYKITREIRRRFKPRHWTLLP